MNIDNNYHTEGYLSGLLMVSINVPVKHSSGTGLSDDNLRRVSASELGR